VPVKDVREELGALLGSVGVLGVFGEVLEESVGPLLWLELQGEVLELVWSPSASASRLSGAGRAYLSRRI